MIIKIVIRDPHFLNFFDWDFTQLGCHNGGRKGVDLKRMDASVKNRFNWLESKDNVAGNVFFRLWSKELLASLMM